MVRRVTEDTVVVIGLGRFGEELARTLMSLGKDVLAIERDPQIVARLAPDITLVVEADGTQLETLKSLGVTDVRTVVVATGASLEASLLATSAAGRVGCHPDLGEGRDARPPADPATRRGDPRDLP